MSKLLPAELSTLILTLKFLNWLPFISGKVECFVDVLFETTESLTSRLILSMSEK